MRPPGLTSAAARSSTSACSSSRCSSAPGRTRHLASGLRRHVPIPVQGASMSTRSARFSTSVSKFSPPTRLSDLHVVTPRALEALVDRGKPSLVRIRCVELSAIFHHGGERKRLTAGAGAQIDHLLAGLGAGEQRGKLRTLVLHLHRALDEGRLAMHRGTLTL